VGEDMRNEITTTSESSAIMSVIERVAMSENADISKLEKMLDMQERVLNRNAAQSYSADMAAMQSEMPRVFKLAEGHNTTYARLEDINDAIRPALQKFGFCVTFRIDQQNMDSVKVTAVCAHKLGHSENASLTLPLDKSGSKNAVQAIGSTVSYGKRYTLCALLNISTGDDTNGFKLGSTQNEKPQITDEGLKIALNKIMSGELTQERLMQSRALTDEQMQWLDDAIESGEKR
jgi:hypothetical protein